jgi:hypothetical protein
MQDLTAKRTLVKSQPELWEELSEVERLAKHLGAFGEIRITKVEPEHRVAWEGEHASGTVSIEPSAWGTKVVLSAELTAGPDEPDPGEAAPEAVEEVADPPAEASATEESASAAGAAVMELEERATEPEAPTEPAPEGDPTLAARETAAERPRRRRRGFWSRLFASWLVPEERLNTALGEPTPPTYEAPVDDGAEEVPTPQGLTVDVGAERRESGEESPTPDLEMDGESDDDTAVAEPAAALDHERAQSVLEETLDALGSAHHRPFSRG